jgi:erythromycin esterase
MKSNTLKSTTLLLILTISFFSCHKPTNEIEQPTSVVEQLRKYVYPLRTYEPDGGDTKDLIVLDKFISDSKVVALGEVTHGSSEIFKMKNRIIQYLAANNGFDIFSIEASMPESYKLNSYTIHGEGNPVGLIRGMHFWTWATYEVLNMVEWMRTFNQTNQRILFTGFDMQFYEGAINELVEAYNGDSEVKNKLSRLKTLLNRVKNRYQQNLPIVIYDNEMEEINSIILFLQNSIIDSSWQASQKEWLLQNIVVIQQCLHMYCNTYGTINWRDKCMADNVIWIKEQNPNSKLVLWAHDAHIMRSDQFQSMGIHLARMLGKNYVTFGFAFFEGSYRAYGNNGNTSYEATQPHSGTLEHLLEQLKEPIFILELKKIRTENKELKSLLDQLDYRTLGAIAGPENEFGKYGVRITDELDYLIYIKTSSASTLLPY